MESDEKEYDLPRREKGQGCVYAFLARKFRYSFEPFLALKKRGLTSLSLSQQNSAAILVASFERKTESFTRGQHLYTHTRSLAPNQENI